ncbi:zinc ABC transporter substrate-binding protein [Nostoc spongiaeforme FACHB-130]|uniref:Zinc ABC transporter substrate-binding protein n=1 Tax=Nostoc spongiaeforme FACHB-130 TaxID=1357510 RepID=A0ABR8FRB2_9NOSO|nr:zinc ABC transporter substrate-binding protein [Nostoc spongiaeforme]MBD2593841.1 zinc ABC transporter substrate-binding protein [Nostoc spongiaeforme FACHB-130]
MLNKLLFNTLLRAACVSFLIGLVGCTRQATQTSFTQTTTADENLPKVVATTSILCDLIKQVAENTVNLACLIPPGTDPHNYQPKAADRETIDQANLIFYNGYNFEPGLIKTIKSSSNTAPKIAVSQLAVPKAQRFIEDGKRVIDPHIWHNPKNGIKMVDVINNNLKKLEPNNAAIYNQNTKQIKNELTQLDSWIKTRIASIPSDKRELVISHNALAYYAKAYGMTLVGVLAGINPENQPTDRQLNSLVKNIQQAKVPTIFAEKNINKQLIQSVAQTAEVKVSERELYTDSLGDANSDANSYQKMLEANTRTIVEALGGTYLIFTPKASK